MTPSDTGFIDPGKIPSTPTNPAHHCGGRVHHGAARRVIPETAGRCQKEAVFGPVDDRGADARC